MRLKSARQKTSLTVVEAWEGLKQLKVGSQKVKNDTLLAFLTLPEGAWAERFLQVVESFKKEESREVQEREYTRGELHMKHGEEEAERFIAQKTYIERLDKDGDTVYVKHTKVRTIKGTRTSEAKVSRSLLINKM